MLTIGIFRSRGLVAAVMAVFSLMIIPVASYSQAAPPKSGSLTGFVYGADMKTPVAEATVKVRNLNTQKEYTSPTDKTGMYKIAEIEEGWYALTVSSILGEYSLNYGVYIKSGEKAKLILSMKGAGVLEGKGLGSNAGKSFLSTPGGILVILAIAGGAGFGVYELTKKEKEASPVH